MNEKIDGLMETFKEKYDTDVYSLRYYLLSDYQPHKPEIRVSKQYPSNRFFTHVLFDVGPATQKDLEEWVDRKVNTFPQEEPDVSKVVYETFNKEV